MRELLPVLFVGLVPIAVLTLIVTGTAFSLVAWQPPILRAVQFGTPNSENGITALSSDPTGVYAAGFVGYQNATPTYLFLNKYDLNGRLVWTNHFDNPYLNYVYGVTAGAGGVYIAGISNSSSFVRAFDLNGNPLWSRVFGVTDSVATTISATSTSIYVGGYNGTTYFLNEYDFYGNLVWTRAFGNGFVERISLHSDSEDVYVLEGETGPLFTQTSTSVIRKYDSSGTLIWTRTCACDSRVMVGDLSSVYAVGTVPTVGGAPNGFLQKTDFSGNSLWTTSFSAPGYGGFDDIGAYADSSGVYLATTTGDLRGIAIRYDGNGNRVWSVQLPLATGRGLTNGDAVTSQAGWVYVAGETSAGNAFMAIMSGSSSLVFFGVNPPFSFGLLSGLFVAVAVSIFWLRRVLMRRRRPPRIGPSLLQKIPTDLWTQVSRST